jgi:hypothetical protein
MGGVRCFIDCRKFIFKFIAGLCTSTSGWFPCGVSSHGFGFPDFKLQHTPYLPNRSALKI